MADSQPPLPPPLPPPMPSSSSPAKPSWQQPWVFAVGGAAISSVVLLLIFWGLSDGEPKSTENQTVAPKPKVDDQPNNSPITADEDTTPAEQLTDDERKALAEFDKGMDFFSRKDYPTAISFFTEAIRLDSMKISFYTNRASAYQLTGAHDKAIADLIEAIRLGPNFAATRRSLGFAYTFTGELDKSIEAYSNAIRLNPSDAEAYYNRGICHEERKDLENAVRDYNKAIRINGPFYTVSACIRLGGLWRNIGEREKCLAACTLGINFIESGKFPGTRKQQIFYIYDMRARNYSGTKEYEKAIADYNTMIRIAPDSSEAYEGRGAMLRMQGKYDKAIEDLTKAIKLDPDNHFAYGNLSSCYRGLGDEAKAKTYRAMANEIRLRLRKQKEAE